MINLAIGDKNSAERRVPGRAAWMQAWRGDDLLAEIRRGVQKQPALAVGADRERRLAARLDALVTVPGQLAHRTQAIPLRNAAARRRA